MKKNIASIRSDYKRGLIHFDTLDCSPIAQFKKWFDYALNANVKEVNAFVLSTISSDLVPSGRVVLLKAVDESGFVFFTNYDSAKARSLESNPIASMTFFWPKLEQQIRIVGKVDKINSKDSDEYFNSRPRESQISAIASNQSCKILNRDVILNKVSELKKKYLDKNIPRPENWGGYILNPYKIEFWQGRPSRLHDRFLYELSDGVWNISRLAP